MKQYKLLKLSVDMDYPEYSMLQDIKDGEAILHTD